MKGKYDELLRDLYEGGREQLRRMTSTFIGRYIGAVKVNEEDNDERVVVFATRARSTRSAY